jgi:hypothetical protein
MDTEGSSPCPQEPATAPCPVLVRSIFKATSAGTKGDQNLPVLFAHFKTSPTVLTADIRPQGSQGILLISAPTHQRYIGLHLVCLSSRARMCYQAI